MEKELYLELEDKEWKFEYVDHDRQIVRAIVYDDENNFYFVRATRDDEFVNGITIETSGGGVENGENLNEAIQRELKEELGVEVEIISKLGVVSDYYNLIHRHNINNYFLCKIKSFGERNLTKTELEDFHLTTLKISLDDALEEYKLRSNTKLGRLLFNREYPILLKTKEIFDEKRA